MQTREKNSKKVTLPRRLYYHMLSKSASQIANVGISISKDEKLA
jgi:hypothetical protein